MPQHKKRLRERAGREGASPNISVSLTSFLLPNSGVKATDKGWGDGEMVPWCLDHMAIVDATYLYLQYSKSEDKIPGASWLVRLTILVSIRLY